MDKGTLASSILVLGILSLSFAVALGPGVSPASPSASFPSNVWSLPRMGLKFAQSSSLNWGGYAVTGGSGSVTQVEGSWIVPTVTCTSATTYVAFWVGIDGYNSNTVEQTGMLAQCSGGTPAYFAWYEFYPNPMYQITSVNVAPGQTMTAGVSYLGSGQFSISLSSSGGGSYSTTQAVSGASESSGEWIVERPSLCNLFRCTLSTLANFGTGYLGLQYTAVTGTNFATLSGSSGAIGSFGSSVSIAMTDNGGNVIAQPSVLSDGGTSFTMAYVSTITTTSTTSSSTTTSSTSTLSSSTTTSTTSKTTTSTTSRTTTSTTTTTRRHHH